MHILLLLCTYMFTIMLFLSTGGRCISITHEVSFCTSHSSEVLPSRNPASQYTTAQHTTSSLDISVGSGSCMMCGGVEGGTEEQAVCMLMSLPDLSYSLPKQSIWVWNCTALQNLSEWYWLSIWGIPTSVKAVIFQHEQTDGCHNGNEECEGGVTVSTSTGYSQRCF